MYFLYIYNLGFCIYITEYYTCTHIFWSGLHFRDFLNRYYLWVEEHLTDFSSKNLFLFLYFGILTVSWQHCLF